MVIRGQRSYPSARKRARGRRYILSGLVDSFLFFVAHKSISSDLPTIFTRHKRHNLMFLPYRLDIPIETTPGARDVV
jgi:hypothetical protein